MWFLNLVYRTGASDSGYPNHLAVWCCSNLCFSLSLGRFSFLSIVRSHFLSLPSTAAARAQLWWHLKASQIWPHSDTAPISPILPQDDFETLFRPLQCFPGRLSFQFRMISTTSNPSVNRSSGEVKQWCQAFINQAQLPVTHRSPYFERRPLRRKKIGWYMLFWALNEKK